MFNQKSHETLYMMIMMKELPRISNGARPATKIKEKVCMSE